MSSAEEVARLREWVGEGIELFGGEPGPSDYEVLVDGWPNAERLEASSVLRSVIVPFTGVPPETLTLLRQRPRLSLHNIHHSGPETAEMALALMFAVCKRIVPMDRLLRKGDWSPRWDDAQSLRLEGKRALVLGYGGIGRRIAKACVGLGMKVTAMRNRPELGADAPVSVVSFQNFAEALACAEVLHIALPLTPRTEGMIGERELAALPKGTILINVARAKIVDERPLFEALSSGHLGELGSTSGTAIRNLANECPPPITRSRLWTTWSSVPIGAEVRPKWSPTASNTSPNCCGKPGRERLWRIASTRKWGIDQAALTWPTNSTSAFSATSLYARIGSEGRLFSANRRRGSLSCVLQISTA